MRKYISNKIFGDLNELSLANRLMCLMSFWGLVFCFISTTVNAILNLDSTLALVSGTVGFLFSFFYYFIRFKQKYEVVKWFFLLTCIAAMTYTWIHNGGYDSSNLYIYFNIFMIFVIISYPKNLGVVISICFVKISSLYFLQYNFPEIVVKYPNEQTRFWDIYLTFAYNFFITFFLIAYVIKNYQSEKNKIDDKNDKIEKMLAEITRQKSILEDFNERLLREQNIANQKNRELDEVNFDLNRKIGRAHV